MHPAAVTVSLLIVSNIFMTFAWYAHLKDLAHKPWIVAALISWGIALLEYMFHVPANRIGFTVMSVGSGVFCLSQQTVYINRADVCSRQSRSWVT
jgi:uncharacterized protein (DUF486 family)